MIWHAWNSDCEGVGPIPHEDRFWSGSWKTERTGEVFRYFYSDRRPALKAGHGAILYVLRSA